MADTTIANTSTTESSSSSQDSYNLNDPLFLHPGENPGAVLTSQPLIGEENYSAWARSVRKSLIGKNKLGFIDGSITISTQYHQNFKVVSSIEILHLRFGLSFEIHLVKEMAPRFSIPRSKLLRFIRENNHSLITSLSLKSCGISFKILVHFRNALVVSVCAILIRG